jgi:hypothetical protein
VHAIIAGRSALDLRSATRSISLRSSGMGALVQVAGDIMGCMEDGITAVDDPKFKDNMPKLLALTQVYTVAMDDLKVVEAAGTEAARSPEATFAGADTMITDLTEICGSDAPEVVAARALATLRCANPRCASAPARPGRKSERHRCGCCSCASYCSSACRDADWKSHRPACRLIRAAKSNDDKENQA